MLKQKGGMMTQDINTCGICGKLIDGDTRKEYHDGMCKAISVKRNRAKSTLKYRLKLEFPTSHHIIDKIVDNCFNGLSV